MRQVLSNKLTAVALIVLALTLVTGVTWASTNNQTTSSVVEIQAVPIIVEQEGRVEILGAGFKPGEAVFFQIFRGDDEIFVAIEGGEANLAGAFEAVTSALPASVEPGLYTVKAIVKGGHVASTPLKVVKKKITTP